MKTTNVMMASLAALLMTGCSQNEVTEVSPDANPQVGFSVYTGASTRGVDMTTASMKDSPAASDKYGGFGIMGYYTGQQTFEKAKTDVTPSFMHNQMVEWDASLNSSSGGWKYSPVKYWPNRENDKISFFAYAPYESDWQNGTKTGVTVSAASEKGIPYINFKLQTADKAEKMVDLVVAEAIDQQYTTNNGGKISFNFKHILSRVSFRAQLGAGEFTNMDGTESFVYITHMWIVGTDHTEVGSNLSLIENTDIKNTSSKFYTAAKWTELHWDYTGATIAKADYSLDKMLNVESPGIVQSNPATGHSGNIPGIRITKDSQGDATKAVPLFKANEHLYLIPIGEKSGTDLTQNAGCAAGDIKIGFHYDIATKDATNSGQYIVSHAEAFIDLPAQNMKRAESYMYTLKINLHTIEISDATVTPWTDVNKDVTVQ